MRVRSPLLARLLPVAALVACRAPDVVEPTMGASVPARTMAVAPPVAAGATYTLLGKVPGYTSSAAVAVNGSGMTVGHVVGGPNGFLAVVFDPPRVLFDSTAVPINRAVEARGVSDAGVVSGEGYENGRPSVFAGPGVWLPAPPGGVNQYGGYSSLAGEVVGYTFYDPFNASAARVTVWSPGIGGYTPVDLGNLNGGTTRARALSPTRTGASRIVVGEYDPLTGGGPIGVMWQNGTWSTLPAPAGCGVTLTYGLGVDDAGRAVGYSLGCGAEAILWTNGSPRSLNPECQALTPGLGGYSWARGIATLTSGHTIIVGMCSDQPTVWYDDGAGHFTAEFLPVPPGDALGDAHAANALGDIVGRTYPLTGPAQAVRWRFVVPTNRPPTANAGGPYTGAEGTPVLLDGSASSDPENAPLTYDWNFGDGSPNGSGATVSHAFPDNAVYTVTLTVSDGELSRTISTTVTTTNVAPTGMITAPSGSSAPQGIVAFTLGNIVEPSPTDAATLQFRFNCGSGWGPVIALPTTSCTIPTTGSKTLRAVVRDKDGAQSSYTKVITITNVGPTVTVLSPTTVTIPAGGTLTFSASFTDPGSADGPWPARVNWGGGLGIQALGNQTPGTPFGASKVYPTPGTYTASVEVKDKFGGVAQRGRITVVVQ